MSIDTTRRACPALTVMAVLALLAGPAVATTAAQEQDAGAGAAQPAAGKPAADTKPATPSATPAQAAASPEAALIAAQLPTYPLGACISCGELWDAQAVPLDIVRQRRLIRVCNAECVKAFDVQAAKWLKVLDDAIIAAQAGNYPLTSCPVSGDALGKKPKYVVVGTRLVEVCCGDCKQELLSNAASAAAALAKIDAALVKTQSEHYPITTCIVDKQPLGDAPLQILYGVTVLRFCSEPCETQFKAGAREYVAQLEAARRVSGKPLPKLDEPPAGATPPGR